MSVACGHGTRVRVPLVVARLGPFQNVQVTLSRRVRACGRTARTSDHVQPVQHVQIAVLGRSLLRFSGKGYKLQMQPLQHVQVSVHRRPLRHFFHDRMFVRGAHPIQHRDVVVLSGQSVQFLTTLTGQTNVDGLRPLQNVQMTIHRGVVQKKRVVGASVLIRPVQNVQVPPGSSGVEDGGVPCTALKVRPLEYVQTSNLRRRLARGRVPWATRLPRGPSQESDIFDNAVQGRLRFPEAVSPDDTCATKKECAIDVVGNRRHDVDVVLQDGHRPPSQNRHHRQTKTTGHRQNDRQAVYLDPALLLFFLSAMSPPKRPPDRQVAKPPIVQRNPRCRL